VIFLPLVSWSDGLAWVRFPPASATTAGGSARWSPAIGQFCRGGRADRGVAIPNGILGSPPAES
jgi:hypothetical protein